MMMAKVQNCLLVWFKEIDVCATTDLPNFTPLVEALANGRLKLPSKAHWYHFPKIMYLTTGRVRLINHFTIVNYDSRVVLTTICSYYDSRVVIYNRKMFIRLATVSKFWSPLPITSFSHYKSNIDLIMGQSCHRFVLIFPTHIICWWRI